MENRVNKKEINVAALRGFIVFAIVFAGTIYISVNHRNRTLQLKEANEVKLQNTHAFDFQLSDWSGVEQKFSDLNQKNWILLNFWATWCEPCVKEFPAMIALKKKLNRPNLEIVAVNMEEDWIKIRSFFDKMGGRPPLVVLSDPKGQVAPKWGTVKIPETYLVKPGGQIVDKYLGEIDWISTKIAGSIAAKIDE